MKNCDLAVESGFRDDLGRIVQVDQGPIMPQGLFALAYYPEQIGKLFEDTEAVRYSSRARLH